LVIISLIQLLYWLQLVLFQLYIYIVMIPHFYTIQTPLAQQEQEVWINEDLLAIVYGDIAAMLLQCNPIPVSYA